MNARILIAESDDRKSDHLLRLLAPHYVVERVQEGAAAIEAAAAGRVDLVIAELTLPGADGHEIVRRLRSAPETKNLPVILLCDTAIDAAKGGGHDPPADDYVSRPFGSLELLMRVQSQLDMVRLRREGEERAMHLLDAVTDGFLIVDARGRMLRCNVALRKMLGVEADAADSIDRDFYSSPFMGGPDSAVARAFANAVASRTPTAAEHFDEARNRVFSVRFFPEDQGGVCVFIRDLTDERLSQAALRDSEERRRLAVEAAGVYDWEYDHQKKRMIYSANVRQVLGFDLPDEAYASVALIHPEDRDEVGREYWTSSEAERPYLREYRFLHPKTGAVVWVRSEGYHVKDATGVSRFVGITQNITARKIAEAASALRADVSSILGRMNHPADIRREVAKRLGQWFAGNRCLLIEVDESAEIVRVSHAWTAPDLSPGEGVYRMSEYVSEDLCQDLMRGEGVAVADVATDPRTALFAASYARDDCQAFLAAPCLVHGKWRFLITISRPVSTAWRPGDLTLLQDLTARVWLRLEQAVFEEQLHVARERLEMAMEAAQIFWWELNLTTSSAVLSSNTSRVLGFDPPGGPRAMLECVHADDRRFIDECVTRARDGAGRIEGEFRVFAPGSKRPVWLSFQGMRAPEVTDGQVRVFGITQNITERKTAESLRVAR